jgi:hypothetical protein
MAAISCCTNLRKSSKEIEFPGPPARSWDMRPGPPWDSPGLPRQLGCVWEGGAEGRAEGQAEFCIVGKREERAGGAHAGRFGPSVNSPGRSEVNHIGTRRGVPRAPKRLIRHAQVEVVLQFSLPMTKMSASSSI